ncbi:extracellular solute-binding protein [Mesorhizobium sp. M3A.F.Ca.ET.201.01.1.1]|uniref:extracellular solute-binding protein n=1 Tax=Mesorhizobium sp. M3A.F.Ca.ET.201.01.1.1 TaxID=2563946 RepID=UPI001093BD5C|nr:extracellular solute-binding protein [Mesorhizobium sp. M3A.F.Ca.ET.201.01.1.1]TGS71763.1 extracellular solute-binding protein [Mesorhizobium sp. M3A.F.Ca.ET.201.01.1.1]
MFHTTLARHLAPINPRMNRRQFIAGAAAATTVTTFRPAFAVTKEVTIQTFETYHEDSWIKEFTEATGIPVKVIRVGSVDEMFSLPSSGATRPDICFIDSGTLTRFVDADLLVPFDPAKVANAANVSPSLNWKNFNTYKGNLWGVPYAWGTIPMMYDADVITQKPTSWAALWDKAYAGKVSTFDDAYLNIPMVALRIGAKDSANLTDDEFNQVHAALKELRPQIRVIAKGFDDMSSLFLNKDAVIAYCQNIAVVNKLQDQGRNVQLAYPDEGTLYWVDNALVTKFGNDRPEVYELINAGLDYAWQARFTEFSGNNLVVKAQGALATGKLSEKGYKRSELPFMEDASFMSKMIINKVPEDIDRRLQLWNDFLAGVL